MKLSEIKSIFDYNFWAFDRVWQCISQISDVQFVEEIDYSTGSIRNIKVNQSALRNPPAPCQPCHGSSRANPGTTLSSFSHKDR